MSGNKAVLDSNALIYASQGLIDSSEVLEGYDQALISIVTLIEVYSYDFPNSVERHLLDEIVSALAVVQLDRHIADRAIDYRMNSPKKIKLADAVILATASTTGADLITSNLKDFRSVDPSVRIITPDRSSR